MLKSRKTTIMILVIVLCSISVLSVILWLFFPTILRVISPTRYVHYSLSQTGKVLSAEVSVINDFFELPDFSDSDVKHLSGDIKNLSIKSSYNERDIDLINLSELNIGFDLLHDRKLKQASLDLTTRWNGYVFPLVLFADKDQVAIGIDDTISWAVNAKTFGSELAGLGLPIDEDFELDLGFLFPDVINEVAKEETIEIIKDFLLSQRFRRANDLSDVQDLDGVAMTALIEGLAIQTFFIDMVDCVYGQSDRAIELKYNIKKTSYENHKLTLFINKEHIIHSVQLSASPGIDSSALVIIKLAGQQSMLDHILIDVNVQNAEGKQSYHIDSKGIHVPVDNVFTSATVLTGFESGKVYLITELTNSGAISVELQTDSYTIHFKGLFRTTDESIQIALNAVDVQTSFGSFYITGDLDFLICNTSSNVRNITGRAHSIADFDLHHFNSLVQILWDIIRQDQALLDIFGHQLITYTLNLLLGEEISTYILDIFGDRIIYIMDFLVDLLGDEPISVTSLLTGILDVLQSDSDNNLFSDILNDVLEGFLGGILPDDLFSIIENAVNSGIPGLLFDLAGSFLSRR
jgi:hypothetical protein